MSVAQEAAVAKDVHCLELSPEDRLQGAQLRGSIGSPAPFPVRPCLLQAGPSQWLSKSGVLAPAHSCPVQEPVMGILCLGFPLT